MMNEPGDDVLARSERTHFQAAVVRSTSLGPDETGKPIEIDDARTNDLRQRAIEAIGRPDVYKRQTLKARVASGNPPEAAQLLGMALQEWAAEGVLGDLTPVAEQNGWDAVVPATIKELATHDGKWVGVPVNIHRPNWLWINAKVFEENGLTPPTTWEEFNAVAERLQGLGITPLAHGGQPWQDVTVFDDVVLGLSLIHI